MACEVLLLAGTNMETGREGEGRACATRLAVTVVFCAVGASSFHCLCSSPACALSLCWLWLPYMVPRMAALRLHRCPILILDEADQLLGDVYAADMAHITEHCGKKLAAASSKGSNGKSSKGSSSKSDGSSNGKSSSSEDLLLPSARQTVLVSATLWAGVLRRFSEWCPEPLFLTMGNSPTWSLEAGEAEGPASKEDAKTWGWGAKGWEGPASVVQQGPKTQGAVGGVEGSGLVPTLPPNLEHRYLVVNPQHKADAMRRAMYAMGVGMGLGFMNWQQRLKDVAGKVAAKKIEVRAAGLTCQGKQ